LGKEQGIKKDSKREGKQKETGRRTSYPTRRLYSSLEEVATQVATIKQALVF